jgi:hypothetical protein
MPDETKERKLNIFPPPGTALEPIDADALDRLLDEWMHGDLDEQRETFEALKKGLDEHRPEGYKLFPDS